MCPGTIFNNLTMGKQFSRWQYCKLTSVPMPWPQAKQLFSLYSGRNTNSIQSGHLISVLHFLFFSINAVFYSTSPAMCSWVQSSTLMFRHLLYFKWLAISDVRHYIWPQGLSHSLRNNNISANAQYVDLNNVNCIPWCFAVFHFQTRFLNGLVVNINIQE